MKSLILVVAAILAIVFLTTPLNAQYERQQLTPAQQAWAECAQKTAAKWLSASINDPDSVERDLCKWLGSEPGEDCNNRVQALEDLGMARGEMQRFLMETVLVPACGPQPR